MKYSSGLTNKVAFSLRKKYHDFSHYNKCNPLWELIFILCSVKTTQNNYLLTYKALKKKYPSLKMLLEASEKDIAKTIGFGGLSNQKAKAIKQILFKVVKKFGRPSLADLQSMSDQECEEFLTSLPSVGKKVARCVIMYSLKRKVFPVDTHCWRICRRIGLVRKTRKDGTCSQKDMDRLQKKIPTDIRYSTHINMISLGREICTPNNPKCVACPINDLCKKIGTKKL